MVGFINALAILIFHAQLHHVLGESWQVWAMVAAGVGMIYGLPRVFQAVPAPLVAIVTLTTAAFVLGLQLPTVGDMRELPSALPFLGAPAVPFTAATLAIVAPFALTLALIGLLESLLTAQLLDDITESRSDKDRESRVAVTSVLDPDGGVRIYAITGELFFASTNELVRSFDYLEDVTRVVLDLTDAHVWDSSAVASLDAVVRRFQARGIEAEVVGLNEHSRTLHTGLTGQLAGTH